MTHKMKIQYLSLLASALLAAPAVAQTPGKPSFDPDTVAGFVVGGLDATAYVDTYYAYELGNSASDQRQALSYSHTNNNQFSVNLGAISLAYESGAYRGNLVVAGGSYVARTVSGAYTPAWNLVEANAGVRVKKGLWLDAGVLPVHWGIESAYSIRELNLTRSLTAESAPYYYAGARLTYASGRMTYAAVVANGWQIATDVNKDKSGGLRATYASPDKRLSLNYSNMFGNEQPTGSDKRLRQLHDVWATFAVNDRLALQGQADYGHERGNGDWYGGYVSARQFLTRAFAVGGRLERFVDANAILVAPIAANGGSVNLDYYVHKNALLRIEARSLVGPQAQNSFVRDGLPVSTNTSISASLAAKF